MYMATAEDFTPRDSLDTLLRNWWLLVVFMVGGGLVGWAYRQFRPPLYEAQAVFYISIDFTIAGEMTQFEEDHVLSGPANIIYSDGVVDEVIADAQAQGIPLDRSALLFKSDFERFQANWHLQVRDPDPEIAATIANLWAEYGLAAIQEAHTSSLKAQSLQFYLTTLNLCLQSTPPPEHILDQCDQIDLASIPDTLQESSAILRQEIDASQGIFPALIFNLSEMATPPVTPLRSGQNSAVMVGGVIGFILGLWAASTNLATKLHEFLNRERNF
jgi:hypothetical protein